MKNAVGLMLQGVTALADSRLGWVRLADVSGGVGVLPAGTVDPRFNHASGHSVGHNQLFGWMPLFIASRGRLDGIVLRPRRPRLALGLGSEAFILGISPSASDPVAPLARVSLSDKE